ncbi:hypothetical protein AAHC03_017256 [Spirometra sp. Aus1]
MKSMLVTALLVSVAFVDASNIIHEVPMNTNFEIVIKVDASSSFSKSDSGFVESALEENCGELNMCVQLLPRRRSLQIYGDPKTDNAKITLIPKDAGLQYIRVAIAGSDKCYPQVFSTLFTESFCATRDFMDSLTLVFDEDIKEIDYESPISKYPKNTDVDGAEVFIPYEQIKGQDYKLLRITGKIADTSVSFVMVDRDGVETNYIVQPVNNLQVQRNPVRFIRWEKKCLCE